MIHKAESHKADQLLKQGIGQYQASQFEAAKQSWQQALKLYRHTEDFWKVGAALGNLGAAYQALGDYDQAIAYYQQHWTMICETSSLHPPTIQALTIQDYRSKGNALRNLRQVYQTLGNEVKAQEYQQHQLEMVRELLAAVDDFAEILKIVGLNPLTDLAGANLSGSNLQRAALKGANLHSTNLSEATLNAAELRNADLSHANLSGADLTFADLSRAKLYGADLSRASLSNTNLRDADLSNADLTGADLRALLPRANCRGANLSRADLSSAYLRSANLGHANLRGAKLNQADLSQVDLSGANLQDADLSQADLADAKVVKTQFGKALGLSTAMQHELQQRGAMFTSS
jgi:uncharacterized protein YjbI with pentapeptide repeats